MAIQLNETERKVLAFLAHSYGWDGGYYSFAPISEDTGLDTKQVRCACRSLKRKGLTEFCSGLWSDEGPGGSGYGATKLGSELIAASDTSGVEVGL